MRKQAARWGWGMKRGGTVTVITNLPDTSSSQLQVPFHVNKTRCLRRRGKVIWINCVPVKRSQVCQTKCYSLVHSLQRKTNPPNTCQLTKQMGSVGIALSVTAATRAFSCQAVATLRGVVGVRVQGDLIFQELSGGEGPAESTVQRQWLHVFSTFQ